MNVKKFNWKRKTAIYIGRFQPFHRGHKQIFLKALKEKGLVKIKNFSKNPNKIGYIYMLTPKGVSMKTRLTINFMKKKMKEKKLNENLNVLKST